MGLSLLSWYNVKGSCHVQDELRIWNLGKLYFCLERSWSEYFVFWLLPSRSVFGTKVRGESRFCSSSLCAYVWHHLGLALAGHVFPERTAPTESTRSCFLRRYSQNMVIFLNFFGKLRIFLKKEIMRKVPTRIYRVVCSTGLKITKISFLEWIQTTLSKTDG